MWESIALVGPESTGKSSLAKKIAEYYGSAWLPEYARNYLTSPLYDEEDLIRITNEQLAREADFLTAKPSLAVLDTDGVVLYVWWCEKYGSVPKELLAYLQTIDENRLYLLLAPDIAWTFDPLRESREDRIRLFELYEKVLTSFNLEYRVIAGEGSQRLINAIKTIDEWLIQRKG